MSTQDLKATVRGFYDLQKLRIQCGNRLVGNWKIKMGQEPGEKEEDTLSAKDIKILELISSSYKTIAEGYVDAGLPKRKFESDGVISSYVELMIVASYIDLEKNERLNEKIIAERLSGYEVFNRYLKNVKGIGPLMASIIITEIDISKAQYVSSLWKYAGLDVAADGRGRGRGADHLIEVEYINKNGEPATRKSITFAPFLKTKLVGVLGPSFLKCQSDPYSGIYYGYKHRLESRSDLEEASKGHIHNMATRYMIKMFLRDLYAAWRKIEGLPVAPDYSEAKLGKQHRIAA